MLNLKKENMNFSNEKSCVFIFSNTHHTPAECASILDDEQANNILTICEE